MPGERLSEAGCRVLGIEVDFVKNPDVVMKPEYAAIIMFVGMTEGWFTGKDLGDYIDNIDEGDIEDRREFTNARRITPDNDAPLMVNEVVQYLRGLGTVRTGVEGRMVGR